MSHLTIVGIKGGTLEGAPSVNYSELGGVESKRQFYPEGAEITHPQGAVYRRIDGDWTLIRYPDGTSAG